MNPVIIIGMHRSGTSLLSRSLEELGVFFGYEKDGNNESLLFQNINEWLLRQANATWDNPYCFKFVDDEFATTLSDALACFMKGEHRKNFLGPDYANRFDNIVKIDFPWGWKDPRNTFTIKIWRKIFPEAKVIHIYRNPIDVANSLQRRELELNKRVNAFIADHGIEEILARNTKLRNSLRVQSLEESVKLWSEYVSNAYTYCNNSTNCMQIQYEDLLLHPTDNLNNIMGFLNLDVDRNVIEQSAKSINPTRCNAFTKDEKLLLLYKKIKNDELVKTLGYDKILS
jgi:hypothetical protein